MEDHPSATSVTRLLSRIRGGENAAACPLFRQVYGELRAQARRQRQRWKGDPSLQTTALVNEAYLKLVDAEAQSWKSRSHFFAVSARAMRHILIDHAPRKRRAKRGGDAVKLSLEALREQFGGRWP